VGLSDGDLVELARAGDATAFRLLVEWHRPNARALAMRLCGDPDDADDIVQEALLRAFTALSQLREPDRFAGWLAGIVRNVHRANCRRPPVTLLADWPEWLQPASEHGLPSADRLDRADALRRAVAGLPAGQRRAVELFYYADLPASEVAGSAGAAKSSLHKARRRLRDHITARRPDLIPVPSGRSPVITVRIAHAEPRPGDLGDGRFSIENVLVVLADDTRGRVLPLWLTGPEGHSLWKLLDDPQSGPPGAAGVPEEVTGRLLHAAGGTVTGVNIDDLGPDVTAARIDLTSQGGGTHTVTARLGEGLAIAAALRAPVRVADTLMDRLAQPAADGESLARFFDSEPGAGGERRERPRHPAPRWHHEPRNLTFGDGLDGWVFGGSFRHDPTGSHGQDYMATAHGHSAVLAAAVPRPHGSAFLGQVVWADDYRGCVVSLRAEIRAQDLGGHAEFRLQAVAGPASGRPGPADDGGADDGGADDGAADDGGTDGGAADSGGAGGGAQDRAVAIAASGDWASYELAAPIPAGARALRFGITLTGSGRIGLRHVGLARARPPATTGAAG